MENEDLIHGIVREWFEVIYDAHNNGLYGAELGITFYDRSLIEDDFEFVVFMAASFSKILLENGFHVYGLPGWVASLDWDEETKTWKLCKEDGYEIAESFISKRDYEEFLVCAGVKMVVEWDDEFPFMQLLRTPYDRALEEFIKTIDFEPFYELLEQMEEDEDYEEED